ncbi:MAG: choice-of-anchor Q domain-containing protein [Kiritimatiellia bacterium]
MAVALGALSAPAETRYVSPAGLHVAPFANWTEAATNLQAAIDVCAPGDLVLVTNGVYAPAATVRVTNGVELASVNGRDATLLDAGALPAGQDALFLQYGTVDGFTVSNAPRHGIKSEHGAIRNCLVTHSRHNGIDSYTTPRVVADSTLVVSNTIVRNSATNGITTCAVDTRIENCHVAESGGTGVALRQNDTVAPIQVPRVSNFLIRASSVVSNGNSGIGVAFWNYDSALPTVPVRIEACRIERNSGARGGGIFDGAGDGTDRSSGLQIVDSVILSNTATVYGGGIYLAPSRTPAVIRSIVAGNVSAGGGGGIMAWSSGAAVENCLIRGNAAATYGGGSWGGILRNNTVLDNEAGTGGGIYAGDVANCIVYGNAADIGPATYGAVVAYSCVVPAILGTGNLALEPGFAGTRNWRLVADSPCIDAGHWPLAAGDADLEGDPRVWGGGVDLGCDEFYLPGLGGPLAVDIERSADRAVIGTPVAFQCDIEGAPAAYVWQFSDGVAVSNTPFVERTFATGGVYVATVVAWNPDGAASNSVAVEIFPGFTNFVSPGGAHVYPYTNWPEAATNIQTAIAANMAGGLVLVDDGVYDSGGLALGAGPTNRVALTNALDVVSRNGPENAWIVGSGPVGEAAVRCAYVGAGARLVGFTLTNGHTRSSGDALAAQSGGGVWCETNGTVADCRLLGNEAAFSGGGAYQGLLLDSTLQGNRAAQGGGAANATLRQCVLSGNAATGNGGGAHGGTLENVLVLGNAAEYGGGAAEALLVHATVADNYAAQSGGGLYRGVASNSILYFNSAGNGWSNYFNAVCRYSCTTPDPQAIGNVTNDPRFVDAAAGVYFLQTNSPALDAATLSDLAQDLAGMPRPVPGIPGGTAAPDMGAYELTPMHYVSPQGGHVWPFLTWADAARDPQSAIDAADAPDAVWVSNGVYNAGGRPHLGTLTNRVVVDKAVWVESVNGPGPTIIEGAGPIGAAAVRGAYLAPRAALVGFTIRRGATRADGDASLDQSGGGIWAATEAVVVDCVLVSNSAAARGGGVRGGALLNSFLHANAAAQGGGAADSLLDYCTLTGNQATDGGGASDCLGRYGIVYFNAATGSGTNVLGGLWETSCVAPAAGPGTFDADPLLLDPGSYRLAAGSPCIDAVVAPFSLPATDLDGTPRPLDGDLDGTARFDVGAHEYVLGGADTDGDGMPDDWEIPNGLAPLTDDSAEDPDGDGLSNLQEFLQGTDPWRADTDGDGQSDWVETVAGTDPLDPGSLFAIQNPTVQKEPDRQIFTWPGRTQRLYTVVGTADLTGPLTNQPDYVDRPGVDGPMAFTNDQPAPLSVFGVRVRLAP